MKTKNKLVSTVILTFLIPPGVVIWLGNFSGLIVGDQFIKLISSIELPLLTTPFMIGIPILLNNFFNKAQDLKEDEVDEFAKYLKWSFSIYIVSSIAYGFSAVPITWLIGLDERAVIFGGMNAVFYVMLANVPFYMKYLEYQDDFCEGTNKSEFLHFSLGNKMLLTNITSALGAMGLLTVNSINLIQKHTNEGILEIGGFTSDLIIIASVIFILLIIPNRIIALRLVKSTNRLSTLTNQVALKNLSVTDSLNNRDEIGALSENLHTLKNNFKIIVGDSRTISVELDGSSNSLKSLSGSLSGISNELAANAEEIAASMEEMASNILLASENSSKSEALNKEGHDAMIIGQELVNHTLSSITTIAENVKKIEAIGEETNMLAINAFVEAANAGEYGKGFAVVAKEVRELADKSMEAAREISDLTDISLKNSNESKIKTDEVVDVIKKTMQMSSEIALAMKEQETGSNQINDAVQEFNSKTQQIASTSEELEASASEVKGKSELIRDAMQSFKID
jgi:methyl-accepting chemotaxis protein